MSDSPLAIEANPTVTEHTCDHCSQPFHRVRGYVYREGDAHAVYIASCYHHDGHEVFIEAVFSPTWEDEADARFTFGCRGGPVAGQSGPGATLVAGAAAFTDRSFFGRKLSRAEGLEHPLLGAFWELVDHTLVHAPVVRDHVYGPGVQFA